ncbi:DUF4190 domain-containing protein [Streptomyces poriferorum]|uniref:DUF4190 domain-containing protein n=1 Tax=Streptomyces poriferorum TaxID=2798799 RepID=A0ABY9ILM4_9ACTN|nr:MULTISPECIES: DUF4190 domain-containing protein [unclassified Streptomyces]MDP5314902.1 DUF4190 domain-containing protein [Streptomyces sp. Alt4]WLQ51125.1 DUF4190 domain-containing protein [Streptomyces sp. Alt1]WLQ56212.1 DUF4190 domain-containing protein [Streptomyces sp. Alt2]
MTLTALTRRTEAAAATGTAEPAGPHGHGATPTGPDSHGATPPASPRRSTRDADGLAVASFVLGLVGLLVMNILLGPAAIVMALVALARSTARRGRALLGLALGIADLVILAFLVTGNGVVAWNFGG